jgi:flagellar biosynthesis/type III secretory pathway M-ring protein FliF/YscJ
MSTILWIVIAVAAAVVIAIFATVVKRNLEARRAERERLATEAAGHRQEAEAHASRAGELSEESRQVEAQAQQDEELARQHEELARQHAQQASERREDAAAVADAGQRAGRAAGFHDEQAAEREEQLS